jgi:HSP90 family molecular chaperone
MKTFNTEGKSDKIQELVRYLYDQAVLLEGGQVDDINAFLKRAN